MLVIGIYSYVAQSGALEAMSLNAADTYYNLLVQGFRAGQLSLKKEVPPGLAQLADPYDPTANGRYGSMSNPMIDMSYYKGKLYLYFGVTPALILFWPFTALTGHYLFHRQAVAIFCAVGFLASVGLLRALWRRYFAKVSVGVVAACVLALGLATGVPVLLPQSDVYEVAISCGYMLTMLALGALWCALHEPQRRWQWLAAASLAYGLALGARPSLLLGAVILLVPVVHAWRERRPMGALLAAAIVPIMLIGLGLMLYNALRFGNPFEFGWHYALGPVRQDTLPFFNPRYLWFNFRVYFLERAHWSGRFPFVQEIVLPALPPGHHGKAGQEPFGVLTNIPLVWLALTVPLAWRDRLAEARGTLRGFLASVTLLVGIWALTIGTLFAVAMRFEVELLPALVLLAVVGILGLERALAPTSESGLAGWPVWRQAARWGWGLLLGFSVAFNLLVAVVNYAEACYNKGNGLLQAGKFEEAIGHYEEALRIRPYAAQSQNNLGVALEQSGGIQEAIEHYEQALRINPSYADAHYNLGHALLALGGRFEAMGHFEQALRIKPDFAEAHYSLGLALTQGGRMREAIEQYEQALRLKPGYAEAHYNLGNTLASQGKVSEAIAEFRAAVRFKPEFAEGHNNLALALALGSQMREAIEQYEQALRLQPDYAEAHYNLAWLLATLAPAAGGDPVRAVSLAQRACELTDNRVAAAVDTLAIAYAAAGRFDEAIATAQKAIDLARSAGQAQWVGGMESRLEMYRGGHPYRLSTNAASARGP